MNGSGSSASASTADDATLSRGSVCDGVDHPKSGTMRALETFRFGSAAHDNRLAHTSFSIALNQRA